ncbi:MAG TPA: hypothetical protein VI197_29880 [Polyangiaceae bacterium]
MPPLRATGYPGTLDTAIIVQQPGESEASLHARIRRAAWLFGRAGIPIANVALVLNRHSSHGGRHSTALALLELLPPDDAQLRLIADGGCRALRHELWDLAGTLIERDGVKHPIAIDFDASHLAELMTADASRTAVQSRDRREARDIQAYSS